MRINDMFIVFVFRTVSGTVCVDCYFYFGRQSSNLFFLSNRAWLEGSVAFSSSLALLGRPGFHCGHSWLELENVLPCAFDNASTLMQLTLGLNLNFGAIASCGCVKRCVLILVYLCVFVCMSDKSRIPKP